MQADETYRQFRDDIFFSPQLNRRFLREPVAALGSLLISAYLLAMSNAAFAQTTDADPADTIDALLIDISESIGYDSNIFREPPSTGDALSATDNDDSRHDILNSATLGVIGQLHQSRQRFTVSAAITDNRYTESDYLNNTGGDASANWQFTLGDALNGHLRADYLRRLTDFGYATSREKDVLTQQDYTLGLEYRIAARWFVDATADLRQTDHSNGDVMSDDSKTHALEAGIRYSTPLDNAVSLTYRTSDTQFAQTGGASGSVAKNNDYEDRQLALRTTYALTHKTDVEALLGEKLRRYDRDANGDFSGATGHIRLNWRPTTQVRLALGGWRELQARLEQYSQYFISRGGSLDTTWIPTHAVEIGMRLRTSREDYQSHGILTPEDTARSDRVSTESVHLTYYPTDALRILLTIAREQRNSNRDDFDYRDNIASIALRYRI